MDKWQNLDQAFYELEKECEAIIRGMTVEIFLHTLKMSPQYYGRYASSWTYRVNSPEFWSNPEFEDTYEEGASEPKFQKGSYPAFDSAVVHNMSRERQFILGCTVYISNGVDHGEGPYAAAIEDGSVRLRAVNQPGRPLGRAIDRAATWYAKTVNPVKAADLKVMRIY